MIKHFISKQFLKYGIVGVIGTGLDFLFLYIMVEYFHLFYLWAAILSIALVFWISFSLNKYWTFANREKKYFIQLGQYLLAHAVGWLINLAVLTIFVEIFGMWYLLAKVFATGVAVIWNFIVTKNWVFRPKSTRDKFDFLRY